MTERLKNNRASAETPTPNEVISRVDAKALGRVRFFTGEPCVRGHISERSVSSKGCMACTRLLKKEAYDKDPERLRALTRAHNIRVMNRAAGFVEMNPLTCTECGETRPAEDFGRNKYRANGRRAQCRKCTASRWKRFQESPNYRKRIEKVAKELRALKINDPKLAWAQMVKNAMFVRSKKRGDGAPSIDRAWLYENAPDICPLLKIPLNYANPKLARFDSPVVDRIDNDVGYKKSNCWVISHKANRIKTDATLAEIETVAKNFRRFMDSRVKRTKDERKRDDEPPPPRQRGNPYAQ